jgi:hypothetical protein
MSEDPAANFLPEPRSAFRFLRLCLSQPTFGHVLEFDTFGVAHSPIHRTEIEDQKIQITDNFAALLGGSWRFSNLPVPLNCRDLTT